MREYIHLTNFSNRDGEFNINQITSYNIMENDYKRQDIIHNAVYNLDRYKHINSSILKLCIENAVIEAGEDPERYINQKLIDDIIQKYNRG